MSDLAEQHQAEIEEVRSDLGYTAGYFYVCGCGTTGILLPRYGQAVINLNHHHTDVGIRPKEKTP